MIDWTQVTLLLYIVARMSGFVLFNPLLGRRNIPGIFRAGLVLVLSVCVLSTAGQTAAVPATTAELAVRLLLELLLGFLLGMVVSFFFYIPQLAGEVIDTQMGMTMNQIYDATAQANLSVSGVLLNVLMTLLFFAAAYCSLTRLIIRLRRRKHPESCRPSSARHPAPPKHTRSGNTPPSPCPLRP